MIRKGCGEGGPNMIAEGSSVGIGFGGFGEAMGLEWNRI